MIQVEENVEGSKVFNQVAFATFSGKINFLNYLVLKLEKLSDLK